MATIHPIESFWQGDQWVINGVANDPFGNPINLAQPGLVINWILVDMNDNQLDQATFGNGILIVNAAAGQFQIIRTGDVTKGLVAEKYQDFCQSIDPINGPMMQWSGLIQVNFSPFAHQNPLKFGWATIPGVGSLVTSALQIQQATAVLAGAGNVAIPHG